MIGNLLNRLGAFLLLPLYTSYLSTSEYGVLEILYATNAFIAMVCGAGLAHATLRFYFDNDKQKDRNNVVTTNYFMASFFTIIGAIFVILLSSQISSLLMGDERYAQLVELAVLVIVFEVTIEVCFAYLRAREQAVLYVMMSLLKLSIQVGACVYFVAVISKGVQGVLWGNLLSVFFVWLFVTLYVFLNCGFSMNYKYIKPILKYSVPFVLSGIIGVLMVNLTLYLIRIYSSLGEVGLYGLAMKFAMILRFVVSEPFQRSYGSFRFSVIKQENAKEIQAQVVHYYIIVASIIALGIALFTPDVLHMMAANEYWGAAIITPIILLAFLFSGIRYCFETGILYKKKTSYIFFMSIISLIVSVVGNVLLIPIWGVYGAAFTLMIVNMLLVVMTFMLSQKLYFVPYDYLGVFKISFLLITVYFLADMIMDDMLNIFLRLPTSLAFVGLFICLLYMTDLKTRDLSLKILGYFRKTPIIN